MTNQEQLISQEHQKNLNKIYHSKLKGEKCSICQNKFSEKDIVEKNDFVSEISITCGENSKYEQRFCHKSCQTELNKEKELTPYLFNKVKQLEKELAEIKTKLSH